MMSMIMSMKIMNIQIMKNMSIQIMKNMMQKQHCWLFLGEEYGGNIAEEYPDNNYDYAEDDADTIKWGCSRRISLL